MCETVSDRDGWLQHFAFGSISTDFEVQLNELQDMFDDFKAIKGVSRIISFGGWSFSTDHDTFPIFREGVTAEERQTFANNVAKVQPTPSCCGGGAEKRVLSG